MSTAYWHYFISLEKDFIRTMDFVELSPANSATYSDNFAKLLLAAGSEVDTICKALCNTVSPNSPAQTILAYRQIITAAFPQMHNSVVTETRTGSPIRPWATWDPAVVQSPTWWTAYNHVKHNRVANFTMATQENAMYALAGLLVINRYYHHQIGVPSRGHPSPSPDLLDAGHPSNVTIRTGVSPLPGIF